MTDFSRNQLSSVTMKGNQVDRWVIPNDRQLLLRSKLGTGWSVRTNRSDSYTFHHEQTPPLTEDELHHIFTVVSKANTLEVTEKRRIGSLVNHYERLKERCHGDGLTNCYLCGSKFHKFRSHSQICHDCLHGVCSQCFVETYNSTKEKTIRCKICSEKRELWKKSGAWFFGDIPPHTAVSGNQTTNMHESTRPLTPKTSPRAARRNAAVPVHHRNDIKEEDETTSTFGDKVQIHIHRYKSGMYSDDDSDDTDDDGEDSSNGSYTGSLLRFKRATDPDTMSICSQHLNANPLLTPARSIETLNSAHHTADEASATESVQDLRLHAIRPDSLSDSISLTRTPKPRRAAEVKFAPDTLSLTSSDTNTSLVMKPKFDREFSRCISIPNADLDEVEYDQEEDTDSPYGSLIFTLFYQESEEKLDIEILGAQHLPDTGASYNPYVSINLVPSLGISRKQRTKTAENTLQPSWKQKLSYFGVTPEDLLFKSFIFSVADERMLGADAIIAEFRLPLRQVNSYELTHYHVYMEQRVSVPSDEAMTGDERGKILLSIRYNTVASQLHVAVVRCAALSLTNHRDALADPYVKLYLMPDQTKASKKKTAVVKRTLNPEFHEEFIYNVPRNIVHKKSLEVTVWNHSLPRNTFLGGVNLALSSPVAAEKRHWNNVVSNTDRRHDCWLSLRDTSSR